MWGSPTLRGFAGLILSVAVTGTAFTGCTSAPEGTATTAPTSEVTSATPQPTPSASATASPTTTPTPSATNTAADQVTIDITIADGKVSPNGDKVSVKVGQKIVLTVTSDEAEEIHAHTADADGYALDVPAGKKVTGSLTLSSPGSYVVEAHHLEKTIVILNAR